MRLLALLLAAAFLSAGCVGGSNGPAPGTPAKPAELQAPWWEIGESWTISFDAGAGRRTSTLVNFANATFNDPDHFWLGVRDRNEAMRHVFFDDNPFLGRIHWEILAPHEKGMHSAMYSWPLRDGARWTSPILLGKEDVAAVASARPDGTFSVRAEARADGAQIDYDYDPSTRWFRELTIRDAAGRLTLEATVTDHDQGASGTYYFLRGRDYLDANGGKTGETDPFRVKDEGATSIAFLLNTQSAAGSAVEFLDPSGAVWHRETLPLGGTTDKLVEVTKAPPAGDWSLRYVGDVKGTLKVRGIIEYKATI